MIHNQLVIPVITIAIVQQLLWHSLPGYQEQDTQIPGHYSRKQVIILFVTKLLLYLLFITQIFVPLFPLPTVLPFNIIGLLLIVTGFILSLLSLRDLGNNWTDCFHYRIKTGQQLVTTGVYRYLRHPIYLAIILEVVGYELIVTSWLFILIGLLALTAFHFHNLQEDALMGKHFGNTFHHYQATTPSLFPHLPRLLADLKPNR